MFATLAAVAATLLAAQPAPLPAPAEGFRIAYRDVGAAASPGKPDARRCLWTATRADGARLEGSRPARCADARRAIAEEVARLAR